jgi:hypothetical protein
MIVIISLLLTGGLIYNNHLNDPLYYPSKKDFISNCDEAEYYVKREDLIEKEKKYALNKKNKYCVDS